MRAQKYEFTPEDDRLTFEVNDVICAHPALFTDAGRRLDLIYGVDAVRERREPPITDELRASMVRDARAARDRKALRRLFPPHRRDLASSQTRFPDVVRDFFDRPHLPIPSPGIEWATDKLLRYWLLTSPADPRNSPALTEFQEWSWDGDLREGGSGSLGRYMMQWLDGTGGIWPDALKAVRRALEVVKRGIPQPIAPDIADAVRIFVAAGAGEARELLGEVGSVVASEVPRVGAKSLRLWCLGRSWPTGSERLRAEVERICDAGARVQDLNLAAHREHDGARANALSEEARQLWAVLLQTGEAVIVALRRALLSGLLAHPPRAEAESMEGKANKQRELGTLLLDVENRTATVLGKVYPLTEQQAEIMGCLMDAGGGWVTAKTLKGLKSSPSRPDRVIDGMPPPIKDCIEGKRGSGYRLRVE